MAIELLDHQIIIDYLDVKVEKFREVKGTAGFAAAAANLKNPPEGFVVPISDSATENRTGTTAVQQNNKTRFGVIVAVQNLRDSRGQKAHTDLRTLRQDILTALLGWEISEDFNPIEYGGGRMLQLTNQVLWWQDEYLTSHFIRSV